MKKLLAIGAGAALLVYLFRDRLAEAAGMVIDAAKEPLFRAVIPSAAESYSKEILQASAERGIDPFVTVALGERETRWGVGAGYVSETGDYAARCWTMDAIEAFGPERLRVGAPCADGRLVTPFDGLGWGRGLMQIDFGSNADWLFANDWRDPLTNIRKGLDIYKVKLYELGSTVSLGSLAPGNGYVTIGPRTSAKLGVAQGQYRDPRPLMGSDLTVAALAAYNAGSANVVWAIAAKGISGVDRITTGGDYSTKVAQMLAQLTADFQNAVAEAQA